jgi:hypothetical protein
VSAYTRCFCLPDLTLKIFEEKEGISYILGPASLKQLPIITDVYAVVVPSHEKIYLILTL